MREAGKLTVVVGSMFSGKSTELQRQGRRKELAGQVVLYFKPAIDNRYDENSVETHDGSKVHAHVLDTSLSILGVVGMFGDYENNTTVCIDEVQFWDSDIVKVVETLLRMGIDVVCSGLDMDRNGEPFGSVPVLMCKAEELIKVRAVCGSCGEDAWVSAGKFAAEEQIVVGEKEKYIPLCRSCFYIKGGIL